MWLSTAPSLSFGPGEEAPGARLDAHFGLILLVDRKTLIDEIGSMESTFAATLVQYLRVSTPTRSFLQVSHSSQISLADIQVCASHLIFWRKARAIPPLHKRDTYIVSPNADMRNLVGASSAFSKAFPTLPPLSQVLSMLSTPRPYSSIIPSKDHKDVYMKVLAWLMKGGWVTQLRSFAWVRVPPSMIEIMDTVTVGGEGDGVSEANADLSQDKPFFEDPASQLLTTKNQAPAIRSPSGHHRSSVIIPNPRQANNKQARYLSAVSKHIHEIQGLEIGSAWDACVSYLDGKHALESIAVIHSWKRKNIAELFDSWEKMGVLLRTRHW